MKKYTILGHLFELDDRAHHFLVRYIERIEHYAKDHGITQDVVDDIKYNIIEKLYRHESPITEKQVLEIANALGEPEVMFDEDESAQKGFNVHFDKIDLSKGKLGIIDRERPVLRGVCYWLSKSLNIDVRIIRIAFIILTLLNGVGIIIYILLALFAPYRDKKKTTGTIGNLIFEIVRIAFWVVVIAVLGPLVGATLFGTGLLFFTPEMSNQSFAAWIPQYMYGTMGAVAVSLLALLIGAIGALFKQRRLNKTLALLATVLVVGGALVLGGTTYRTAMLVNDNVTSTYQTAAFSAKAGTGALVIDTSKIGSDKHERTIEDLARTTLKLSPATGSTISVSVETVLRGVGRQELQQAVDALNPLQIQGSENMIVFVSSGYLFQHTVPFTIVERVLNISVPTNRELIIHKRGDDEVSMSRHEDENRPHTNMRYRYGKCLDDTYVFDVSTQSFVCKEMKWESNEREEENSPIYGG